MRWEDERWVKVYTRDTAEWLALGWEAQALFLLLLRKSDRAGLLHSGRARVRGLAALAGMPLEVVERALPLLLEDGCVQETDKGFLIPNFIAAQEAETSGAQRSRTLRERDRDKALASGGPAQRTQADISARLARAGATHADTLCETETATQDETQGATRVVTVLDTPRVDESRQDKRETTLSESAADESETPADLRALWNAEADPRLPRWRELTPKRSQQAAARLREHPLAEWRIILGRINGSPFCLGQNDRGWKADVEFFLRPDTATRVLEGKYDPKPGEVLREPTPQRRLVEM
jgi:hypothetical protein